MRMLSLHSLLLVGLGFLATFVAPCFAKISVSIPSRLTEYETVDRLEAYGCASTTFRALRPLAHFDVATGLKAIRPEKCAAPEWLLKERELMLRPARQNEAMGTLLFLPNDTVPLLGTESVITPSLPLREGRPIYAGPNLMGEVNFNADAGQDWGIALSATPAFTFALEQYRHLNARFYVHEVYVKAGYRRIELTWGRLQQRFGDFRHGSLILSGAAKPLDLVKLALRPHLLPSFLSLLGPFTIDTWVASGGDSLFLKNSKLWAVELGFRPFTFYELALIELYQFGGSNRAGIPAPSLEVGDVLNMLYYANSDALNERRHRGFGIYQSIWGPDHYAKLYAELFFDSLSTVSSWFSRQISTSVGLWFPKVGLWNVRLEYVNTVPNAYAHSQWRQGWSVEGSPLGHPLGSDATGAYLDVGLPGFGEWLPEIGFSYEKRNSLMGVTGTHPESRYGTRWSVRKRWVNTELMMSANYQYAQGYQYRDQETQSLFGALVGLKYSLF